MATKKKVTKKKASVAPAASSVNEKAFKQITEKDFRNDLEYYTKDSRGNFNPAPQRLSGHLAKDATAFHSALVRGGVYVKTKSSAPAKKAAVKAKAHKPAVGVTTSTEGNPSKGIGAADEQA